MRDGGPLPAFLSAQVGPLCAEAADVLAEARPMQLHAGASLLHAGQGWSQLFRVEQGALRLFYVAVRWTGPDHVEEDEQQAGDTPPGVDERPVGRAPW